MGRKSGSDKAKAAAGRTKKRFQDVWRHIRKSTDEHWAIGLRPTANLIGFALYPVGWSWVEYPRRRTEKVMPYESKAEETGHLNIKLDEADTKEGAKAFRRGILARRAVVERHLLRMIQRKEIPVTIVNDQMEGHPLSDTMRLNEALTFDVSSNVIGLFDLGPNYGFPFYTDANAVLDALEDKRAWDTNVSVNDWLKIERYLRELFETLGVPATRDEYATKTAIWYAGQTSDGDEPAKTELRALVSRLYAEYAGLDSEI